MSPLLQLNSLVENKKGTVPWVRANTPGWAVPVLVFLHSPSHPIPLCVSIQASLSRPLPQPALRFWYSLDKFPVLEVS